MNVDIKPLQLKHRETLKLIKEMREPYDSGEKVMPGEKLDEYHRLLGELKSLESHIEAAQSENATRIWSEEPLDHKSAEHAAPKSKTEKASPEYEFKTADGYETVKGDEALTLKAWNEYLAKGAISDVAASKAFNEFQSGQKDMQADSGTGGGYLVAPRRVVNRLLKGIDDQVRLRSLATVERVGRAQSLGVPTLDTDFSDTDWVAELSSGSDDELVFGDRELNPHPSAKRVKVSNTLLAAPGMDVESVVMQRLQYRYAATAEKAYMTGDGARKPLGLFTPSANGIPTTRDKTGGTSQVVDYALLAGMVYNQKEAYWPNCRWIFNRVILEDIRTLTNPNGQYIWQPNFQQGQPQTVLGFPIVSSEFAPAGKTTGSYIGVFGDFRFYWILDALNVTVQRNPFLYQEKNQTGFFARYEGDGAPVLAEAFTRGKLT